MTSSLLPQGFRDRMPPEAEAAAQAMTAALSAIGARGYRRVAPPLAEYEEALVGRLKSAGARDLLRVLDPASRRMLALRPDITPQVGRIAGTRLAGAPRPLRLCYAGTVVRLAGGQLNPARELTQLGAELIGRDTVAAAAEIVAVAVDALQAAGATGLSIDLTLPDLVDLLAAGPLPLGPEKRERVRAILDAKDAGALVAAGAGGYLPLLEATGPFADAVARLRSLNFGTLFETRLAGLEAIVAPLGDEVRLTLDPTERHGFEYQSWFGFSLFADGHGAELGRGGSYTVLHGDGREEPAVGVSLYPDPLFAAPATGTRGRLFLPIGHRPAAAAAARADGWITVAAIDDDCDPALLDCTHRLAEDGPQLLG
ncbi:ATP phosphoribosyltransferase regulatory subunit [Sphingomonas jejuensis]|uniref:ATP phosphoribosyltransferase regulatory subunit n=1 Tax=Sphingomonas jejuensis TaxID=904715 RepID=A0ABX0XPH1_9SPHN|nr:ATP phosphoribosyltransferase regulatory subunit [Sphingomonas jejuensis]NJC35130.1 ATP phosphoribosyltransferase regulatory subunit [Sphingomonas jejuensis]